MQLSRGYCSQLTAAKINIKNEELATVQASCDPKNQAWKIYQHFLIRAFCIFAYLWVEMNIDPLIIFFYFVWLAASLSYPGYRVVMCSNSFFFKLVALMEASGVHLCLVFTCVHLCLVFTYFNGSVCIPPEAGCTKVLTVALANGDRIHHDGCSG